MNEMRKTGLFVAAAALSLGLAWFFRPVVVRSEGEIAAEKRGVAIFPDLDPDTATSFRLTQFNEAMATLSRIELSKDTKNDLWTLPSADGYPADSAEQVSRAITPLVELKVLSTVSTDRGDHALYGVVEPNEQDLTVSASGVGMLINVGGEGNKVLASLIVGKKVEGRENQHFVRVPSEDAVYEVEINTDGFTTDLEKWIKGEILNVRSFDIENVGLRDYAILRTERGYGLGRNFDADLENKDNKWSLTSFVDHSVEGSPATNEPPEGKKLNEQPLNDLRNNVQNLKIVNVRRKPAGLAADLKADASLMENEESTANLQSQGFFPMETGEVFSAGGELIVGTKEGVRYLLRFGNTRVSSTALDTDEKEAEGEDNSGVNRYLLVMAQLDETKFPAPELKVVPETVEEMLAQEAAEAASETPELNGAESSAPSDDANGNTPQTAEPPPTESGTQPEDKSSDSESEPESKEDAANTEQSESGAASPEESSEPTATEPTALEPEDAGTSSGDAREGNSSEASALENPEDLQTLDALNGLTRIQKLVSIGSQAQEQSSQAGDVLQENAVDGEQEKEPSAGEVTATDNQVEAAPASESAVEVSAGTEGDSSESATQLSPSSKETPEELKERLEFLQETLRKENQRLIDSRNEKLAEARKKVAELNARFADWYYVVSDSVYNKLRISRDSLFQSADAASGASTGDSGAVQLPELPPGIQLPSE